MRPGAIEPAITCLFTTCVDFFEVARRTGRFPQLVDPRSSVNGLLFTGSPRFRELSLEERRSLCRLKQSAAADAHPLAACPRQLRRSISCSVGLLRLDSSRIVNHDASSLVSSICLKSSLRHRNFLPKRAPMFASADLSCKEVERLGHEVCVELKHRAVSGIGIDNEIAIRKTPRQIVRVLAWHHAITIAVCDKYRLINL